MSSEQEGESPPRPAKLTDIAVRGKALAKPTERKSGDLTRDVIGIVEERGSPRQNEPTPPTAIPSTSIVAIAYEQPAILDLEPPPKSLVRSDIFSFDNVGTSARQFASPIPDVSEQVSHRSAVPIFFGEADCSDGASGRPADDGAARVSAPSAINTTAGATEWCLVEQSQPVRTPSALDVEVLPALAGVSSNLVTVDIAGRVGHEYRARGSATLPQIIAMALGALLIITGVVIAVVALWRGPMTSMGGLGAGLSTEDGWFGLAFILVGATLEAIGVRSRSVASAVRDGGVR
jgi:hypothetical protein